MTLADAVAHVVGWVIVYGVGVVLAYAVVVVSVFVLSVVVIYPLCVVRAWIYRQERRVGERRTDASEKAT